MTSTVLWRRLSATDFRAMNGSASPFGRGGGAMHIALGVRTDRFPIDSFLSAAGKTEAIISATADHGRAQPAAQLAFSGNPRRRGGEWRIRDQYSNRHPAWTSTAGFPTSYDINNPPYILVFRTGNSFYARYSLERDLQRMPASSRPKGILSDSTGLAAAPPEFMAFFRVPSLTRFEEFQKQQEAEAGEAFDPKNLADGRKRILGAVIRRLGQRTFRRKLISAYDAQCALTRCRTLWVLEAAHITPYRGTKTNAVSNGLLLRADVHTLFDLALIAIEPSKLVVRVSRLLKGSQYEALDGRPPLFPAKAILHPSPAALEYHYEQFQR